MSPAVAQISLEICPATIYTDAINHLVTEAAVPEWLCLSQKFVSWLWEQKSILCELSGTKALMADLQKPHGEDLTCGLDERLEAEEDKETAG